MTSSHRYISTQIAAKVLAAVTLILLAREATKPAVGLYVSAILAAAAATIALDAGSSKTALRLSSRGLGRAVLVRTIQWRLRVIRVVIVGSIAAAFGLHDQRRGFLVSIVCATASVMALNAIEEATLLGEGRGGIAAAANVLFNLVSLAGTIVLVGERGARASGEAFLVAYLFGALSAQVLYIVAGAWHSGFQSPIGLTRASHRLSSPGKTSEWRYSLIVVAVMAFQFLYFRADLVVLSSAAKASVVALYAVAYRVFELALTALQLVSVARQPTVVRSWSGPDRAEVLRDTYCGMLLLSAILTAGVLLAGPTVTRLLFGMRYQPATVLVTLLAFGTIGQAVNITTSLYMYASTDLNDAVGFTLVVNGTTVVIAVVAILSGYAIDGIRGVAVGESLMEVVTGAVLYLSILRRLGVRPYRWVLGCLSASAIATALLGYAPRLGWAVAVLMIGVGLAAMASPSVRAIRLVRRW